MRVFTISCTTACRSTAISKAGSPSAARLARARGPDIDRALFDPKSYEGVNKDVPVSQLMKTRTEIERKLAAAEARWIAASEALEQAGAEAA